MVPHYTNLLRSTLRAGKYKIFIFREIGFKAIYQSDVTQYQYPILLYYHDKHFDGIRYISKFFNARYYCLSCQSPYTNAPLHNSKCKSRCINCTRVGPKFPCKPFPNYRRICYPCTKIFKNRNCYEHHLQYNICNKSKQCEKCGKIWRVDLNTRDGRSGHECAEKYCFKCGQYHRDEECFIQKYRPRKQKPYRIIAYDFEATQVPLNDEKNRSIHQVNFVCAKIICTQCIEKQIWHLPLEEVCNICGPHRTRTWSPIDFTETKVDKHVITDNPLKEFTEWILYEPNNKYQTVAFAHFGGRYDCTLIFGELIKQHLVPTLIRQGNKLYEMTIAKTEFTTETIFRDSFNYVSQKLESLVKAFELPVEPKMWFPHMYNKEENYNTIIPHLPPKEDYLFKSKKPKEKQEFEKWYSQNQNNSYNFNETIAEYCVNDVEILIHALVALQKTVFHVTRRPGLHTGIDILYESMTIASVCMKTFRLNHLKPNQLAIVPENSYSPHPNQSLLAIKFLEWYSYKNKLELRTALSIEGEKNMDRYLLDGYNKEQNLGIEVHGCYFHGCPHCFPDDQTILCHKKTAGIIRKTNQERKEYLETKLNRLEIYYECEIKQMLKEDEEMTIFFNNYTAEGPIQFRNAFFGGRTGPMKIYHKVKPGEKISYKDVRSLYPYTNFKTSYPIGHPKRRAFKHSEQQVNWTNSSDNPYRGILKVLIVPPKTLRVAALPTRIEDDVRLLFPLCKICPKKYPEGGKIDDYECKHSEKNRQFVSTCTHIELNEALDVGYRVKRIFHVLEYEQFDDEIFKGYVREFFKIKLKASGFDKEFDTIKKQDQFLNECEELFGIKVKREDVQFNAALRTLAKICLNSLWGRFALRNQLSKTIVTDDPYDVGLYFNDPTIEICFIDELDDNLFLITYNTKEEFIEEHGCSNVLIALWTTSAARIHLLKLLQKVDATSGCEILYMDTDSVIYVHPENNDPLSTGPHLGDLTDECDGKKIVEFVSAGCKNYAMMLKDEKTPDADPEYILKVRGITLDYNTCQILQYETFKQKVLNYCNDNETIIVKYNNFLRPNLKKGTVYTVPMEKKYRPVISKGIVNEKFEVVNFGTCYP